MGDEARTDGAAAGDHARWLVFWCYDGWHPAADRLEALLAERAPWALLRRVDPTRPLHEQVVGAKVRPRLQPS